MKKIYLNSLFILLVANGFPCFAEAYLGIHGQQPQMSQMNTTSLILGENTTSPKSNFPNSVYMTPSADNVQIAQIPQAQQFQQQAPQANYAGYSMPAPRAAYYQPQPQQMEQQYAQAQNPYGNYTGYEPLQNYYVESGVKNNNLLQRNSVMNSELPYRNTPPMYSAGNVNNNYNQNYQAQENNGLRDIRSQNNELMNVLNRGNESLSQMEKQKENNNNAQSLFNKYKFWGKN